MNKKIIFAFIAVILSTGMSAQKTADPEKNQPPSSIGMVISTNDIETVWNALRLANYSLNEGDTVSIFLLGKGVELENLIKSEKDIKEQTEAFLEGGGLIMGCGTCLQSRKNNEPQICRLSSMKDLYDLIRMNKHVLTF
jgi:hypothetical protein